MKNWRDIIVHRWFRVPYTLHVTRFQDPKHPRATLVFLHGIGNTADAWSEVVTHVPKDVRAIGIDLLGFGRSPKPTWVRYDATQQARAVGMTLAKLGYAQRVVLVGHSLGALVSVAIAKRYPFAVQSMILCSPPFYKPKRKGVLSYEDMLRMLYDAARHNPEQLMKLFPIAKKLGIANPALNVNDDNIAAYVAALNSSIINQSSLQDLQRIRIPTHILYGTLDPVIIPANITKLAKDYDHVTSKKILTAHEVVGTYAQVLVKEILRVVG